MLRLSLFLLTGLSCAPAPAPAAEEPNVLTLILFAAPGLELGDELRAALTDDDQLRPLLQERDPQDPLFRAAFGDAGRLGLAWIDGDDRVLSVIPGFAPAGEVRARTDLVQSRWSAWTQAGDEFTRARLQVELRAFVPAEARLRALLAEHDSPDARERLARVLARAGLVREALDECERVTALDPGYDQHPGLQLTRALAWIASREPQRALAVLTELPAGDQVSLALGLAQHHAEQGDGLVTLGALIQRYPHSPWCADARREIEHILSPPAEHTH